MKRVYKALALMGAVSMGVANSSVTIPLTEGRHNPLAFRDAVAPAQFVAGTHGRLEYVATKPDSMALGGDNGRVFTNVLKRVYSKNGGITLSPDVMLFLVANAVADHVAASGDTYRNLFTNQQSGKEPVMIENSALRFGAHDNDWSGVLPRFMTELAARIPTPAIAQAFKHDFSTSTPLDKACGAVVLMHASKNFYQPEVLPRSFSLGPAIAAVKVKGTKDDWQRLSGKVMTLGTYFPPMQEYLARVADIVHACANSFDTVDTYFWKSMYFDGDQGWIKTLLDGTDSEMTSVNFQWGANGPKMKFVCGVLSYSSDDEDFLEPSLGYSVVYQ